MCQDSADKRILNSLVSAGGCVCYCEPCLCAIYVYVCARGNSLMNGVTAGELSIHALSPFTIHPINSITEHWFHASTAGTVLQWNQTPVSSQIKHRTHSTLENRVPLPSALHWCHMLLSIKRQQRVLLWSVYSEDRTEPCDTPHAMAAKRAWTVICEHTEK